MGGGFRPSCCPCFLARLHRLPSASLFCWQMTNSMENHVASSSYDVFGEPEIMPQVGNEYQAELPQLLGDSNTLSRSMDCADDEIRADSLKNFHIGSPIKLAWISSEKSGMRGSHDWIMSMDEIDECRLSFGA